MQKLYVPGLFLVLVTVVFSGFSTNLNKFSTKNQTIILQACIEDDLIGAEDIFVKSFAQAYKISSENFDGFSKRAKEVFNKEFLSFNESTKKINWINAKKYDVVVGFIVFENTEKPHEVYIRQMAVDPALWGNGIGTMLIGTIFETLPDTNKIVLVTRKTNTIAQSFYTKLGFKFSDYIHEGLSSDIYLGFELDI